MKDKIRITGPPDPPAGRPSVRTFNSTATIAWSSPPYDGGCMVTGYRVEMKKVPHTSWTVVTDRCHSLSHTVHDLAPGIEYMFRVRAENVHGASEASAETASISIGSKSSSGSEEEEVEAEVKTWDRIKVEPGEVFTSRYEIMEELGKGRYGVVHKVVDKTSSQKMAAKFVRCIKKQDKQKVFEEIEIMNCLRHPKLLQLVSAYDNTREIVMVTEYITGGELFERVVADDFTLTERDCMLFMRQICEGVDYMHQNSVVHLDLKPENIMCYTRTSHQIKIIDFGLAQKLCPSIILRVLFGTPEFIPPEIINYEPIGVESDMWSVGVICYVLLSGLSPFMGDNDAETFANITRADFDFDDEAFDAISQDVKDLISNLLVKRKEKRFSARQCLEHKWMSQCDKTMSCVKLSTDKLKKFIIRRKWQKTGNAIRALGRMATLSAASRRNSATSSQSSSPRQSLAGGGVSRMSSLNEEEQHNHVSTNEEIHQHHNISVECNGKSSRVRVCSERSDSGISDCSSINAPTSQPLHGSQPLTDKAFSISEENEMCDVGTTVESKTTRSRDYADQKSKTHSDKSKSSSENNESFSKEFDHKSKTHSDKSKPLSENNESFSKEFDHKSKTHSDKSESSSENNESLSCYSDRTVGQKQTRFHDVDKSRTHKESTPKLRFDKSTKHQVDEFKEATRTRFADNLKPSLDEASFKGSKQLKEASKTRFADNLKPSLDEASFKGSKQLKEATKTRFAENLKPSLDEASFKGSKQLKEASKTRFDDNLKPSLDEASVKSSKNLKEASKTRFADNLKPSLDEESFKGSKQLKEATKTRFAENLKPSLDEASFKGSKHLKEASKTRFADNLKPSLDEESFKGSLGGNKVDVENNRRNDSKSSVCGFISTNKRLEDGETMKVSSKYPNSAKTSVVSSLRETSSGLPKSTNSVVSSSPFLNNSFLTDDSSSKTKRNDDNKCLDNFSDSDAARSSSLQAGGLKVTTDARARSLSPALQKDAKVLEKSENFQKAFAFWKR